MKIHLFVDPNDLHSKSYQSLIKDSSKTFHHCTLRVTFVAQKLETNLFEN